MRPSFTVSGLMAAVVVVALGLVALRDPGPLTASLVYSLALAILLVAGILGCARRGRARAGWLSMAIVGLAYLHFAFVGRDPESPALMTTAALARVFDQLPGADRAVECAYDDGQRRRRPPSIADRGWPRRHRRRLRDRFGRVRHRRPVDRPTTSPTPTRTRFIEPRPLSLASRYARGQVGHSLLAILVGLLGGLAGRMLAERDDPAPI